MAREDVSPKVSRLLMLASIMLVIASLYLAQEVLVPLALAALLSFLLAPLVHRFERLKLPRVVAVLITVIFAFTILGGVGYVVYNQLVDLTEKLPQYRQNIQSKVESIRSGGGFFTSVQKAGNEVQQILTPPSTEPTTKTKKPGSANPAGGAGGDDASHDRPPSDSAERAAHAPDGAGDRALPPAGSAESPFQIIKDFGGRIFGAVGTLFIVIVFTVFMLLQREDLRDRVIRLVGRSRLTVTTEALDDAAERVSRYLLMQSIINGAVGVVVMVMLWGIGKLNGTPFPSPALFGLLAGMLRFMPYIGIWVAASMPLLLSLAVYSTASVAAETLGAYIAMEIVAGNVLEPLLFGSSTGITTLAVLVAAAFWTWLWGPVGLILSTPMTVCTIVIGKYVPGLSFLNVLLADEPALDPPDRVYQRLLAMDDEEAEKLVEEYARKMPLEALFDTVLLPALAMAERDEHAGSLDAERHTNIRRGMRDIIEDLGDRHRAELVKLEAQSTVEQARTDTPMPKPADSNGQQPAQDRFAFAQPPPGARVMVPQGCVVSIVCLPAFDESDEIASIMLAQLLELRGYCAAVVSAEKLASEMMETVTRLEADLVCVSALPPAGARQSRYLCKRLQATDPELDMIVGLWTARGELKRARQRIITAGSVQIATSFGEAMDQIHQRVQPKLIARGGTEKTPPTEPAKDPKPAAR